MIDAFDKALHAELDGRAGNVSEIGATILAAAKSDFASNSLELAKKLEIEHSLIIREANVLCEAGEILLTPLEGNSLRYQFELRNPEVKKKQAICIGSPSAKLRNLANEVAIALVFDGGSMGVLMATPSLLEELAIGFALSEGIVSSASEIQKLQIVDHDLGKEARLWLVEHRSEQLKQRRRIMAGPIGCGLCGIETLEQARRQLPKLDEGSFQGSFGAEDILGAMSQLRHFQPLHDKTRSLHASGYFVPNLGLQHVAEDVGRHNALDKVIGQLAKSKIATQAGGIVVTSRISVELVQKTVMAGIYLLAGVSAPTALAVEIAQEVGLTLIGHCKDKNFDVFCDPHGVLENGVFE